MEMTFIDAIKAVIASNPHMGKFSVDVIEQSISFKPADGVEFIVQPGPEAGRWLVERWMNGDPAGHFWGTEAPLLFNTGVSMFIKAMDMAYSPPERV